MSIASIHKTVISMGHGSVLTGMAVHANGVGSYVFMTPSAPNIPGLRAPELDNKFGIEDADVVIMFADLASVTRMIDQLNELHGHMIEKGAK